MELTEFFSSIFAVDQVWCRRNTSGGHEFVNDVDVYVMVDEDDDAIINLKFSVIRDDDEDILLLCPLNVDSASILMYRLQYMVDIVNETVQKKMDQMEKERKTAIAAGWPEVVKQVKKELGIA